MTGVQHISMRVPWRDQPWDDKVCSSPLDNSSCLLLKNIGDKRLDDWEEQVAGASFPTLSHYAQMPCLSERATFMSAHGYQLDKEHPYRFNQALRGHLEATTVSVPPYAFEAVPFRWLSRETVEEELWQETDDYRPEYEEQAHRAVGFTPSWLMDGRNQRVLIDRFFLDVKPEQSLVFVYLKHSPLQEESTRRLLVGAALVTGVTPPLMWNQSGQEPFGSSMWETIVSHSLRPEQLAGTLLSYQSLIPRLDAGEDISAALAWAPEDATVEFSYVTEHVSDDTAIASLSALRAAADGMHALGIAVPASALTWLDTQIERIWRLRGPAPGLSAVLSYLGVESAHQVARRLAEDPLWDTAPWGVVERALTSGNPLAHELGNALPPSIALSWRGRSEEERAALKLLSAMDVNREQVGDLMDGQSRPPVSPDELVDNPYYAATCTYRSANQIALATVDQACFPAPHVRWANLIGEVTGLSDPGDARRVEALIVEVLERLAAEGDTIAGEAQVLSAVSELPLTRPCPVSAALLRGQHLDAAGLADYGRWTPLVAAELDGGAAAYKLVHLEEVGRNIASLLTERRATPRFPVSFLARELIDEAFGPLDPEDGPEELARAEKSAGLEELFASRLSVLVGPAGTGKTSLLKTLVGLAEVAQDGVLLLAPTGKARVQMQTKVGHEALTLASFLVKKGGYDPETGLYLDVEPNKRTKVGLVIIDEASMLTEEMLSATLSALTGVKRLIFVGDHRQLPPIGAGRRFVDIVEWLKPDAYSGAARVGPGYVELTVFRRQVDATGSRDDLALARWFGGEDLPGAADDIWQHLRLGEPSPTVTLRRWGPGGVLDALISALEDELGLADEVDLERAFKLTYGGQLSADGKYVNWNTGSGGAGDTCESWQILSPTRSRVFGTVELNRALKRRYRSGDLRWAQNRYNWRPPRPLGPEQIVYGDKVMQTRNDSRARAYPAGAGLDYVANGEIGVVTGRTAKSPKFANVEFSSQVGATYSYWPSSSDDPPLELAWAVTVHKSQGSEFGTTFLVLPARVAVSRELLYTALTRQTDKVVILHEGTIENLFALASPALSETARRLTDLFRKPAPRELRSGMACAGSTPTSSTSPRAACLYAARTR